MSSTPAARRLPVALALIVAVVVGLASPAAAHVTVNPGEATKGAFTKLAFRVPNERDDARTVKIEIAFPEGHPIAFVSTRPHAGWEASVTKTPLPKPLTSDDGDVTEAVSRITWTAIDGVGIGAGEFDEFEVSLGPLPADTDTLVFKALQTYSDGEVVRWIEEAAGGAEAEHPAPVLTMTAASGDDHHTTATTAAAATDDDDGDDEGSTKPLAVGGLLAGLLGLVLGAAALARGTGRGSGSTTDG